MHKFDKNTNYNNIKHTINIILRFQENTKKISEFPKKQKFALNGCYFTE